ncbi:MAG: PilZ domain-containing protein [Thermodesulforhabdaceae bacterium]
MNTRNLQIKRVFVKDGSAVVVCDICGRAKKLSGISPQMMSKPVMVTCPCGNSFRIVMDARKHYRKAVNLRGTFRISEDGREYPMIVENISFSGIGIRSPFVDKLKEGDQVEVKFNLDDTHKSLIERIAVVRHVNKHFAGLEFVQDRSYDKVLGFYLMQ